MEGKPGLESGLGNTYMVLGIQPKSTICMTSALSTVLSL